MHFQAVLSNAQHPEYGASTIPFPIPVEEYDHVIELLEALEIGDAVDRDCHIDEIRGSFPALDQMEQTKVNLDELDYLSYHGTLNLDELMADDPVESMEIKMKGMES